MDDSGSRKFYFDVVLSDLNHFIAFLKFSGYLPPPMGTNDPKKKQQTAGQYYLMEKLAQGGMAEIYKGLSYDVHGLKKTVCIKKILPHLLASSEFIDSLIDEAKLAVRLVHGNIAQTYDLGKVGDDYFMVMEYVDGRSLSQIHKKCLSKGELIPIPILVFVVSEVLNGLNYMHRRTDENGNPLNIVHRDISPQNIMVSYSGTVKIIDFGIAKAMFKVGSTDSGVLKGKFAYMSPEQAHGDALDQRSDVFSLGIILHEMITGKRLFKAEDSRQTIRNVRRAQVESPSLFRADLPDELDRISMKALSKDRRRRYLFASEMHNDLVKFLYTTYPEFKPSDIGRFLQELFADDIADGKVAEADTKTPHLIIDKSNSALMGDGQFEVTGFARAPLNMHEYMLGEMPDHSKKQEESLEPAEKQPGESETGVQGTPLEARRADREEKTSSLRKSFFSAKILVIAAIALVCAGLLIHQFLAKKKEAPVPPANIAEIVVTSTPEDASIAIDNKIMGSGSPVTIKNISTEEEHTLEISREGFIPQSRVLKLAPGEKAVLTFTLASKEAPHATVEISTSPSGATIFIDDKETAKKTPAAMQEIPPGKEVSLGLFLSGYKFWSKKILLKNGETRSFDVEMMKDYGSLFVDSSPPDAIVMLNGAPIGQTPLTKEKLEPGHVYKIEIWREGFAPYTQEIKIDAGRKEEIRAILNPAKAGIRDKG